MKKKKKKPSMPKIRHTWAIRPETRVTPSAKIYRRSGKKSWVDNIDWFGEEI